MFWGHFWLLKLGEWGWHPGVLLNILQCTENDPNVSIAKGGELGTQMQVGGDAGLGAV